MFRRLGAAAGLAIMLAGCTGSSTFPVAGPARSSAPGPTRTPHRHHRPARTPKPSPTPKPTRAPRPERYVFPVQGCPASPSASHHDYPASDIFTNRGCRFVAVTSGRVDEVSAVDRWNPSVDAGGTRGGLSVSIVGDDGVRYYGSHLLSIGPGIHPGARVHAGQLLGRVDNSGDAKYTATHLHFGISWPTRPGVWWVRRGEVWPQPYLADWRAGRNVSPRHEVLATERRLGKVPTCTAEC